MRERMTLVVEVAAEGVEEVGGEDEVVEEEEEEEEVEAISRDRMTMEGVEEALEDEEEVEEEVTWAIRGSLNSSNNTIHR